MSIRSPNRSRGRINSCTDRDTEGMWIVCSENPDIPQVRSGIASSLKYVFLCMSKALQPKVGENSCSVGQEMNLQVHFSEKRHCFHWWLHARSGSNCKTKPQDKKRKKWYSYWYTTCKAELRGGHVESLRLVVDSTREERWLCSVKHVLGNLASSVYKTQTKYGVNIFFSQLKLKFPVEQLHFSQKHCNRLLDSKNVEQIQCLG